jgi:glycolate oxidase FAD binding subunit
MESIHSNGSTEPSQPQIDATKSLGVNPVRFFEPKAPGDLATLLSEALSEGKAVIPVGGATQLSFGNAPRAADWIVSTKGLDRILSHEPADLTASVEAGVTLAALQEVLSKAGQHLPIECPHPEQSTIGGLVATALVGPRRSSSGTLRDYLIGIAVAYPDGTVGKAGGMVVKNVSGFDLMRLHQGALGTLGVIVSVNLKVMPAPKEEATVKGSFADLRQVEPIVSSLTAGHTIPTSLELFRSDGDWSLACRWEGRGSSFESRVERTMALIPSEDPPLENDESRAFWNQYGAIQLGESSTTERAVIRIPGKPANLFQTLADALEFVKEGQFQPSLVSATPRLGTVTMTVSGDDGAPDRFPDLLRQLRSKYTGTFVVSSPTSWKENVDSWGYDPELLSVMRSLKREFDPTSVINPGRFAGGI